MLGVARLVLLGHRDSGLPGWPDAAHLRALVAADPLVLARQVAEIADAEGAATVVHDDEQGIYGHPDHCATWRIGSTAAGLVGATGYAVTIDREHLHVVARDGHLVHGAARAAAVDYGRVTAEIALASPAPRPTSTTSGPRSSPTRARSGPRRPSGDLRGGLRLRVVPPDRRPRRAGPPRQRPPRRRLRGPSHRRTRRPARTRESARSSVRVARFDRPNRHIQAADVATRGNGTARRLARVVAPAANPAARAGAHRSPRRPAGPSRPSSPGHGRRRGKVLLYLGFAPRTLWWLALPAFGLLGATVHGRRARAGFGYGALFGLGFLLPLLSWTGDYVGPVPWLALSAPEAVFVGPRAPGWPRCRGCPARRCGWRRLGGGRGPHRAVALRRLPVGEIAFGQPGGLFAPVASLGGAPLLSFARAVRGRARGARAALAPRRPRRGGRPVALLGPLAGLATLRRCAPARARRSRCVPPCRATSRARDSTSTPSAGPCSTTTSGHRAARRRRRRRSPPPPGPGDLAGERLGHRPDPQRRRRPGDPGP